MEEYADSTTALVADVDCTAEGAPLCQTHGVGGYPTIKYGDPQDLQDYNGGRNLEDLQAFAKENLKQMAPKSGLDQAMNKLKRDLKPLIADITHILELRKNAAAVLLVGGILIGLVLGLIMSRLCCSSRAVSEDKKND